jgi:hypothetical protein
MDGIAIVFIELNSKGAVNVVKSFGKDMNNRCNGFACVFVLKEGRLTNALVSDANSAVARDARMIFILTIDAVRMLLERFEVMLV